MDSIANRARSHLANRHSAKATFGPGEVASLAASYALLDHSSPEARKVRTAIGNQRMIMLVNACASHCHSSDVWCTSFRATCRASHDCRQRAVMRYAMC